ncbi:hypothetical protein JL100_000855 [Skermanella mucosa]|uniref:hypothetical protein n=1 Tax=Skermanella mucosa TaxID=1789672 RepID=UPI00192C5A16|nr:hypothetical protein [Skermanella mucosa]UEM21361.1 hypothetical protein JL100_000855 [Skermanella mucosa]
MESKESNARQGTDEDLERQTSPQEPRRPERNSAAEVQRVSEDMKGAPADRGTAAREVELNRTPGKT